MKYRYNQEMLNEVYRLIGRYLNRQYEVDTDNPMLVFYPKKDYAYPLLVKKVARGNYPVILSSQQIQDYVGQYRVANEKRALTKWKVQFLKELKEHCQRVENQLESGNSNKGLLIFEKANKDELYKLYDKYTTVYNTITFKELVKEDVYNRVNKVDHKFGTILKRLIDVITYENFVKEVYSIDGKVALNEISKALEVALSKI